MTPDLQRICAKMDPPIELLPTHARKKPGQAQTHAAGAMQEVLAALGEAHLRFVWVTIVESETVELARDLNLHKEHVAAEYVSLDALTEVTAAINRLGDRLDNLFIHLMSQSSAQQ